MAPSEVAIEHMWCCPRGISLRTLLSAVGHVAMAREMVAFLPPTSFPAGLSVSDVQVEIMPSEP